MTFPPGCHLDTFEGHIDDLHAFKYCSDVKSKSLDTMMQLDGVSYPGSVQTLT